MRDGDLVTFGLRSLMLKFAVSGETLCLTGGVPLSTGDDDRDRTRVGFSGEWPDTTFCIEKL